MSCVASVQEMPQGAACCHSRSSMRVYICISYKTVSVTYLVVCNHLPVVFVAISLIYITGCSTGIAIRGKLVVSCLALLNTQFSLIGW